MGMLVSLSGTGHIWIRLPTKIDGIANLIQGTKSQRGYDSTLSFRLHH